MAGEQAPGAPRGPKEIENFKEFARALGTGLMIAPKEIAKGLEDLILTAAENIKTRRESGNK